MANYLYNGVELPALPEWDKETYPYAWIQGSSTKKFLYIADSKVYGRWSTAYKKYMTDIIGNYGQYHAEIGGSEWTFDSYGYDNNSDHLLVVSSTILWTNHDIINEDGTLYQAASPDPIPVPTIDPNSMLAGYLVGCRLRSLRGK